LNHYARFARTGLPEVCDNIWIFGKETWSSETPPEDPIGDPRNIGDVIPPPIDDPNWPGYSSATPSYAGFGAPYLFHKGEPICIRQVIRPPW